MLDELRILERLAARSAEAPCLTRGIDAPCWLWGGTVSRDGYGKISVKQHHGWRPVLAHRAAYSILIAPIPDGLELDHLCRVRVCWNPWHLDPVTRRVNILRGLGPGILGAWQTARTHCRVGHMYDHANTRVSRDGKRHCRACERARGQRRRSA